MAFFDITQYKAMLSDNKKICFSQNSVVSSKILLHLGINLIQYPIHSAMQIVDCFRLFVQIKSLLIFDNFMQQLIKSESLFQQIYLFLQAISITILIMQIKKLFFLCFLLLISHGLQITSKYTAYILEKPILRLSSNDNFFSINYYGKQIHTNTELVFDQNGTIYEGLTYNELFLEKFKLAYTLPTVSTFGITSSLDTAITSWGLIKTKNYEQQLKSIDYLGSDIKIAYSSKYSLCVSIAGFCNKYIDFITAIKYNKNPSFEDENINEVYLGTDKGDIYIADSTILSSPSFNFWSPTQKFSVLNKLKQVNEMLISKDGKYLIACELSIGSIAIFNIESRKQEYIYEYKKAINFVKEYWGVILISDVYGTIIEYNYVNNHQVGTITISKTVIDLKDVLAAFKKGLITFALDAKNSSKVTSNKVMMTQVYQNGTFFVANEWDTAIYQMKVSSSKSGNSTQTQTNSTSSQSDKTSNTTNSYNITTSNSTTDSKSINNTMDANNSKPIKSTTGTADFKNSTNSSDSNTTQQNANKNNSVKSTQNFPPTHNSTQESPPNDTETNSQNSTLICNSPYMKIDGQCQYSAILKGFQVVTSGISPVTSVPSARTTCRFLNPVFIFVEDLWFYRFHQRQYSAFMNRVFDKVNTITQDWFIPAFLNSDKLKSLLNLERYFNSKYIDHTPKVVKQEQGYLYFLKNSEQLYTWNILFNFLIFAFFAILFQMSKKFRCKFVIYNKIHDFLREKSLFFLIWVNIIQANLIYLSFYSFLQIKNSFLYQPLDKLDMIVTYIYSYSCLLYSVGFYVMIFVYEPKEDAKKLLTVSSHNWLSSYWLETLINGCRNFINGFLHAYLMDNYAIQISLLCLVNLCILILIVALHKNYKSKWFLIFSIFYQLSLTILTLIFVIGYMSQRGVQDFYIEEVVMVYGVMISSLLKVLYQVICISWAILSIIVKPLGSNKIDIQKVQNSQKNIQSTKMGPKEILFNQQSIFTLKKKGQSHEINNKIINEPSSTSIQQKDKSYLKHETIKEINISYINTNKDIQAKNDLETSTKHFQTQKVIKRRGKLIRPIPNRFNKISIKQIQSRKDIETKKSLQQYEMLLQRNTKKQVRFCLENKLQKLNSQSQNIFNSRTSIE